MITKLSENENKKKVKDYPIFYFLESFLRLNLIRIVSRGFNEK